MSRSVVVEPSRSPRTARSRKARHAAECLDFEQIPNIGKAMSADLRLLGLRTPAELARRDAFELYQALCRATGQRQDPCVLDTLMAACDFMRGGPPVPWWHHTPERKRRHPGL